MTMVMLLVEISSARVAGEGDVIAKISSQMPASVFFFDAVLACQDSCSCRFGRYEYTQAKRAN